MVQLFVRTPISHETLPAAACLTCGSMSPHLLEGRMETEALMLPGNAGNLGLYTLNAFIPMRLVSCTNIVVRVFRAAIAYRTSRRGNGYE